MTPAGRLLGGAEFSAWRPGPGGHFLALAVLLAAILGNALPAGLWTRDFRLHGPYLPEIGHAWVAPEGEIAPPLPRLTVVASDHDANPGGAGYALSDGAGPLGPAHSLHAAIRDSGQGRYSFWRGRLLFSTRQGEDPNAEPLALVFTGTVTLALPALLALDVAGGFAAFLLVRDFRRRVGPPWARLRQSRLGRRLPPPSLAAVALFTLVFDAATLRDMPHTLLYSSDSDGYYALASFRPAGYGLLLRAVESVFGDPYAIVPVQFALAALSVLVLCAAVRRVWRSPLLAIAIGLMLTIKQGLVLMHFTLLPDSLFFSCATATLGLALLLLERPRIARVCATGAIVALALMLRPAALGLLPGLGLAVILIAVRQRRRAGLLAVLLIAGVFGNGLIQPIAVALTGRAEAGAGKFSGFVLIGSAGFLLSPETPTALPDFRDRLVAALAPVRAAWIAAPTIEARRALLVREQDPIIYRYSRPALCDTPPRDCTSAAIDAALRTLAIDALRNDPQGLLAEVVAKLDEDLAVSLSGDWLVTQEHVLGEASDSFAASAIGRPWLQAHGYDLTARAYGVAPDPIGLGALLSYFRGTLHGAILVAAIASIGWLLIAALRRRLPSDLAALGVAAFGFLGYHVFVCLVEVPILRYAEPLTAWFLLTLGGFVLLAARRLRPPPP